jgi:hypothetical protein
MTMEGERMDFLTWFIALWESIIIYYISQTYYNLGDDEGIKKNRYRELLPLS